MEKFIEYLYSKFLLCESVSIDSRTVSEGALFFGLNGPNFKGSRYASAALDKGAFFAVIDDSDYTDDPRIIYCENTLKALQTLATFHRSFYKNPLIALTGSNGKTTTKELILRALSKKYITHATKGNLNNHIGVPLTLLGITPQTEMAIIEMGANHVGEINELCQMAQPTHGLITNIGYAHTASFGGFEGVVRGKSELFEYLRTSHGLPFINTVDKVLANMIKRFEEKILYPSVDMEFVNAQPMVSYSMSKVTHQTHLLGAYNYMNIAAAYAVGTYFKVDSESLFEAVNNYQPDNMRSQFLLKGSNQILLDAYNANPDSMRVALSSLESFEGDKFAILGDMNELEESQAAHLQLLQEVDLLELKMVIIVGPQMALVKNHFPEIKWFATAKDVAQFIRYLSFEHSTILIKGSRSIKLESVLSAFN
ncbi:MAG: UDP-N-acetylmuramoyl-tripeptide--D-alanyl-D-alanine ligase [Flammeovirgaceae bacterium]|nr:UDP-N-acetylmuramoyl-tripeptide--D-alanyl-D-alanine ligase [Flammeovirgaceae bacterium]